MKFVHEGKAEASVICIDYSAARISSKVAIQLELLVDGQWCYADMQELSLAQNCAFTLTQPCRYRVFAKLLEEESGHVEITILAQ